MQQASETPERPPLVGGDAIIRRRGAHFDAACKALRHWRYHKWLEVHSKAPWGVEGVLPDQTLSSLAAEGDIMTIMDIKDAGIRWLWSEKYGAEVLALLANLDSELAAAREAEAQRAAAAVPAAPHEQDQ
ncbi:hypothetical protein BC834DRAFT_974687 [Gloeopeniophorella convolvens]|nr:hypothetical protein BC834DRAFT_974687 [Gloeopeniophorella convolvens]